MTARLEFFPVDNGDMTLVTLETGRTMLIDCRIRGAADDDDDPTPDVASLLRDRIEIDSKGRPFVDVFVLTHPDQDHIAGLRTHFHLGEPSEWTKKDNKILIREMWSSPIIFRRKDRIEALCEDAEAWRTEARRRVKAFRDQKADMDGNRIVILGEDIDHKTEGLEDILVRIDDTITAIAGEQDGTFSALLLGPLEPHDDEDEEEVLAKNRSSVIVQFTIGADGTEDACLFLIGGDAEVGIWERQWSRHSADSTRLAYDVLLTPHHCSWHSLSHDSWSDLGEEAAVSEDALAALSEARDGAFLIASSKPITDDDSDPPCVRAEREYVKITDRVSGQFICVADHVADAKNDVLLIQISAKGPSKVSGGSNSTSMLGLDSSPRKTEKRGGGRYARPAT